MARTYFKSSRWMYILCVVSIAVPLLLLLPVFGGDEWWVRTFLVAMSVVGVIALIETATAFMRLDTDALQYRSGFVFRCIPKSDIRSVTWEGGVLSLRMAEGNWLKLPSLGRNSQGMANSIRAWLKPSGGTKGRTSRKTNSKDRSD